MLHIDYKKWIYILNHTELNCLNDFQGNPRDPYLSHQFWLRVSRYIRPIKIFNLEAPMIEK